MSVPEQNGVATPPGEPPCGGSDVSAAYRSSRWSGQTRGGTFGNWFFLQLIRLVGMWAAYIWLAPIVAYYLVASPRSVRNSRRYLRRMLGPQPFWKWPILIYRHFYSLGMTLLDRSAMMMGRDKFSCTYEGETRIAEALALGKGVILVSAHIGNWAAGSHLLKRLKVRVNMVALENEVQHVQAMFDRAFPDRGFQVLPSTSELASSVRIMQALQNGEIVAFNGDRALEGASSVEATFLDDVADFPIGAYLLASVTGAPVFHVFAMRDGIDRYRFFCSSACYVGKSSRRNREAIIRPVVDEYVRYLESVLKQYPFQWYNFYPFWKHET